MAIIEAGYRSISEHRPVRIDEIRNSSQTALAGSQK
jgi:hypothetical protein